MVDTHGRWMHYVSTVGELMMGRGFHHQSISTPPSSAPRTRSRNIAPSPPRVYYKSRLAILTLNNTIHRFCLDRASLKRPVLPPTWLIDPLPFSLFTIYPLDLLSPLTKYDCCRRLQTRHPALHQPWLSMGTSRPYCPKRTWHRLQGGDYRSRSPT